ncbi:MAG: hypothetical protein HY785_27365 [Oscillatoriophycideae cyanobacterium NC_groundwater_1537_Pr4_S-0.65um_50_18]|nr:hypothetical protein [Oscillatoriophycideae cyanobacterium NC_groundwater_1537_Pr4_S-0.65um_50_18]
MRYLVADPSEITQQASYIGLFSQVGNLLWCATAAICLFTASIFRAERLAKGKQLFFFLLFSGLFSGQLLLDDLFRLHEKSGRVLFGSENPISTTFQNLAELLVFAIYGLATLIFITKFKSLILHSNYLFLLLAIAFFGLSILVDLSGNLVPWHDAVEESFKLLGIFSWFVYFLVFCTDNLRSRSRLLSE